MAGYNTTWPSCLKLTSSFSPGHLEITVHLFDCSGKVIEENLRSIYKLIHLESCKCTRREAIFDFVSEKYTFLASQDTPEVMLFNELLLDCSALAQTIT